MREVRIVIVGGGFSGTLVATHLLQARGLPPLRVTIVEPTGRIGCGVAYGTTDPEHVLNVPAARMSAFPEIADHFLRFAVARDPAITPTSFVRRSLYGEYMADCLASAERASSHRLVRIRDEVTAISASARSDRESTLTLASGAILSADAVVVAVGAPHAEHSWAKNVDAALRVRSALQYGMLSNVPPGARVVLIGTGLTMADVAITLSRDPAVKMTAVSRHGLLPRTHASGPPQASAGQRALSTIAEATTTMALVRKAREAIAAHTMGGGDWRAVIDGLRPVTGDLWMALEPMEQRRFLRHVRPFWEVHRHRIPPTSGVKLASLIESGRLVVETGRVENLRTTSDGAVDVALYLSRRREHAHVRADIVFDCTGPTQNLTSSTSGVLRSLLDRGLATVDPSGLGLRAETNGELVGRDGRRSSIFAVGPLLRGRTYEATAVPELRVDAQRTATAIARRFASHANTSSRDARKTPNASGDDVQALASSNRVLAAASLQTTTRLICQFEKSDNSLDRAAE